MNARKEKKLEFDNHIKINFDGGNLTTDSGLLIIKEYAKKIDLENIIKEKFVKIPGKKHQKADIMLQCIYQHIAGYEADDCADLLRKDPIFLATVQGKEELASQPTLSRFWNSFKTSADVKKLQEINDLLLDKFGRKEGTIIDLDSTNCDTYGEQYGANYNGHYSKKGYHPLVAFDAETGDFIKSENRAGQVYTSRQVVRFTAPLLKKYKSAIIRGDSGFAIPNLYKLCEIKNCKYVIRLKSNNVLAKLSEEFIEKIDFKNYESQTVYGEFLYKAKSWDKERRVVVKIEKPEGFLISNRIYVVTNTENSPEATIDFYSKRGNMENYIKEAKNGFRMDRLSSTNFMANTARMLLAMISYNLINTMKRKTFPEHAKTTTIETIRIKLIKIASRVVYSGRYIYFKMCSACPFKNLFWTIYENIVSL